jgi:hypothetical protein
LVVLELKSALEEGTAHELGFPANLAPPQLVRGSRQGAASSTKGVSDFETALLEMANVETLVAAPRLTSRKSDATRLAGSFDLCRRSAPAFERLGGPASWPSQPRSTR